MKVSRKISTVVMEKRGQQEGNVRKQEMRELRKRLDNGEKKQN